MVKTSNPSISFLLTHGLREKERGAEREPGSKWQGKANKWKGECTVICASQVLHVTCNTKRLESEIWAIHDDKTAVRIHHAQVFWCFLEIKRGSALSHFLDFANVHCTEKPATFANVSYVQPYNMSPVSSAMGLPLLGNGCWWISNVASLRAKIRFSGLFLPLCEWNLIITVPDSKAFMTFMISLMLSMIASYRQLAVVFTPGESFGMLRIHTPLASHVPPTIAPLRMRSFALTTFLGRRW